MCGGSFSELGINDNLRWRTVGEDFFLFFARTVEDALSFHRSEKCKKKSLVLERSQHGYIGGPTRWWHATYEG
jgi:hypothetical protein